MPFPCQKNRIANMVKCEFQQRDSSAYRKCLDDLWFETRFRDLLHISELNKFNNRKWGEFWDEKRSFLADNGYPVGRYLITSHARSHITYNRARKKSRNTTKRMYGMLKGRFSALRMGLALTMFLLLLLGLLFYIH